MLYFVISATSDHYDSLKEKEGTVKSDLVMSQGKGYAENTKIMESIAEDMQVNANMNHGLLDIIESQQNVLKTMQEDRSIIDKKLEDIEKETEDMKEQLAFLSQSVDYLTKAMNSEKKSLEDQQQKILEHITRNMDRKLADEFKLEENREVEKFLEAQEEVKSRMKTVRNEFEEQIKVAKENFLNMMKEYTLVDWILTAALIILGLQSKLAVGIQ